MCVKIYFKRELISWLQKNSIKVIYIWDDEEEEKGEQLRVVVVAINKKKLEEEEN